MANTPLGTQTRIVGGGHTLFSFMGHPIALLDSVMDSGQLPAGRAYEAITSVGDTRPREIVTQPVMQEGKITLALKEVWNAPVWWRLGAAATGLDVPKNGFLAPGSFGLQRSINIQDIFQFMNARMRAGFGGIDCTSWIWEPSSTPGVHTAVRGKQYFNCVVDTVADGDQITVAGLSTTKNVTVVYTHTRDADSTTQVELNETNYAR